jgi:hypothetical protein
MKKTFFTASSQHAQDARREKNPPQGIYFELLPSHHATTPNVLSSTFGIDLGFNI